MVSESVASQKRSLITDRTHNVSYYDVDGLAILDDHGTSEIAAADASGMAISLTTTVNLLFGSQLMVPETGVIMNDEMNGTVSIEFWFTRHWLTHPRLLNT